MHQSHVLIMLMPSQSSFAHSFMLLRYVSQQESVKETFPLSLLKGKPARAPTELEIDSTRVGGGGETPES